MERKLLFASNRLGVQRDYFCFAFDEYAHHKHVRIAVPYFTEFTQVLKLVEEQGCTVDLIVCLNRATSPDAVAAIMGHPDINVRCFADSQEKFHAKLYIFGSDLAFIGSSNMTNNGLHGNIELNLGIESDDPRFEHIQNLFLYFWDKAKVLDEESLEKLRVLHAMQAQEPQIDSVAQGMENILGPTNFDRIESKRGKYVLQREVELFQKHYQKVVSQYRKLVDTYIAIERRKSAILPLYWETDQFLSWLYERSDVHLLQWNEAKTRDLIAEFMDANFDYIFVLEDTFAANTRAVEEIRRKQLDEASLRDFMKDVHAFATRKRYHLDYERLFQSFVSENTMERIQKSFHYLLFSPVSSYERMARCIYDPDYKLSEIGDSCVKEIYGRNNDQKFPICNERTMKAMRMLGMQV